MPADEVSFEPGVLLVKKDKAAALKKPPKPPTIEEEEPPVKTSEPGTVSEPGTGTDGGSGPDGGTGTETGTGPDTGTIPPVPTSTAVRLAGQLPPELWNRLGTKILPKLRSNNDFTIQVTLSATVDGSVANDLKSNLNQIIADLGLEETLKVT